MSDDWAMAEANKLLAVIPRENPYDAPKPSQIAAWEEWRNQTAAALRSADSRGYARAKEQAVQLIEKHRDEWLCHTTPRNLVPMTASVLLSAIRALEEGQC